MLSSNDMTLTSPTTAVFSRRKSSALLMSLGGGDDTGVLVPQPLRFSLAQLPQLEKYAPARVDAACKFACACDKSGVWDFPAHHISTHLPYALFSKKS